VDPGLRRGESWGLSPHRSLDLNGRAGFRELLGDLVGFLTGDVLLDVLGSAFDQVLGFLEAQVRTDAADFLDDVDLLVAAGRSGPR
jgi:hypothetical protein